MIEPKENLFSPISSWLFRCHMGIWLTFKQKVGLPGQNGAGEPPMTFKNQSLPMGIRARGNDLQLGSPPLAKRLAHDYKDHTFLFSNCLPKSSSIFHHFTAETNASLKFNRMWTLPPGPSSPTVIYVDCFRSQIPRANIGLSSSWVSEFSLIHMHLATPQSQETWPGSYWWAWCG